MPNISTLRKTTPRPAKGRATRAIIGRARRTARAKPKQASQVKALPPPPPGFEEAGLAALERLHGPAALPVEDIDEVEVTLAPDAPEPPAIEAQVEPVVVSEGTEDAEVEDMVANHTHADLLADARHLGLPARGSKVELARAIVGALKS
jgi:hypothetical protein